MCWGIVFCVKLFWKMTIPPQMLASAELSPKESVASQLLRNCSLRETTLRLTLRER